MFVSPFGISNSLILALMAAEGDTKTQILDVLNVKKTAFVMFDSFNAIDNSLKHTTSIKIDNTLWLANNWASGMNPRFIHDFKRFGKVQSCNFHNESRKETAIINAKIEGITNDLITQPLDHKNLTDLTIMLFTNTMYFKASWKILFTVIKSERFKYKDGKKTKTAKVDMMFTDDNINVNYYRSDANDIELIELPLESEFAHLSFIMLRPTDEFYVQYGPTSTIQFETKLTSKNLTIYLESMKTTTIDHIALPIFSMYNKQNIKQCLMTLGITDLFDPSKCNLQNMTKYHYQIYEDSINRQDFLSINNQQIEIASLISDGNTKNMNQKIDVGPVYHADKPFIFLIMDRSINLILYAGRVTNPHGWKLDKHEHHHHHGTGAWAVLFILFIIFGSMYCCVRYAYNVQVL